MQNYAAVLPALRVGQRALDSPDGAYQLPLGVACWEFGPVAFESQSTRQIQGKDERASYGMTTDSKVQGSQWFQFKDYLRTQSPNTVGHWSLVRITIHVAIILLSTHRMSILYYYSHYPNWFG